MSPAAGEETLACLRGMRRRLPGPTPGGGDKRGG